MSKGKLRILEQGRRERPSASGGLPATEANGRTAENAGESPAENAECLEPARTRSFPSGKQEKPPCGGGLRQISATQLPSLLARFHEMSSPMVELVLETGCL